MPRIHEKIRLKIVAMEAQGTSKAKSIDSCAFQNLWSSVSFTASKRTAPCETGPDLSVGKIKIRHAQSLA